MQLTRRTLGALLPALLVTPVVSLAQSKPEADRGAESITEADVRRKIEIIAHDSMGGRDTPSPGLDLAARWVASEFERLGLTPGGDSGSHIQRYPMSVTRPEPDSMVLELARGRDPTLRLRFYREIVLVDGLGQPRAGRTTIPIILAGAGFDSTAPAAEIEDRLVLWVSDWSRGAPENGQRVITSLRRAGARGVLVIANNDSLLDRLGGSGAEPIVRRGPVRAPSSATARGFFVGLVRESSITGPLPEAKAELGRLREPGAPALVPAPDWSVTIAARGVEPEAASAPNVVGIVRGSDPVLADEYLVISAHLDHVGGRCGGRSAADSICNGADDDASGTAGLLELAEALTAPGARPRRSVIVLGVSGEERGLWGSEHFVNHSPVALDKVVANLNMDMIGRNWTDSVVAIGKEHSDLGSTVDRIAREHPELRMTVLEDPWPAENLYYRSDHYNFAVKGVPVLFFTSGLHPDYHAVTDSPEKIDAEKEARILRLIYWLIQDVGNRAERPAWRPESYRAIVARGRR